MKNPNKAKFDSQQKTLETIDKIFLKNLKERDQLVSTRQNSNREEIISIDLLLSELIKNRARLTKGGYNFILKHMWEWTPFFPIKKNLLPKTIK